MAAHSAALKKPRLTMVCNTCGSEDVRIDAWAAWNVKEQRWVLGEIYDYAYCNKCEDDCRIVETSTILPGG